MKIIGDHELLIEATRVQEFLLYGAEGPWGAVENHVEENKGGIKLSAQAAAALCAIVLSKEESAAKVAVTNGMQVEDVMEAVRQLKSAGLLHQETDASPRFMALEGLRISEKGEGVLKKNAITEQHRFALELLQEKANTLEEFDLPPSWNAKLDVLFPEPKEAEDLTDALELISESQFASLCAIASNYLEGKTPDVKIGQTISVSPRSMVILHEVAMKRAQDLAQVAEWYRIPEKKLRNSLHNLINCGLLLIDEYQETKNSKQIDIEALILSENASRILENRRCSFEDKALVAEPAWGQYWFTEKGLKVALALVDGEVTPESIAAMDIGLSVDGAIEMLSELDQLGLLEKGEFVFKASARLEVALQKSHMASPWAADKAGLIEIEKSSVEELLELERKRIELEIKRFGSSSQDDKPRTRSEEAALAAQRKRDIESQKKAEFEAKTLQKAVRIAQDKLVASLIDKGTRQNRTEFYAQELTSQVRKSHVPEKSNENIQHLAIEQMFKNGFLTTKPDFEGALRNGVHPNQYQPIVVLSPLGDAQGEYKEFKEAHKNYEHFRTQKYLNAINTHETQEAADICYDNDFDEEDFAEFLGSPLGRELVGSVTKFDEANEIFYKALVLNSDTLKEKRRHDVPIIDYFSSIEPFSLKDLTRVFPVNREQASEDALIELLTREKIIEETPDNEAHYKIADKIPSYEVADAMKRIWKKVTNAMSFRESIPDTVLQKLNKDGFCSIKDHAENKSLITKEAATALQKSGVARRFRTKGGRLDYLFLNEELRGLNNEQLKEEIEKMMMGTGSTEFTNGFETRHLNLDEFTSRVLKHDIQLPPEEMPYYERAQRTLIKMRQKNSIDETKARTNPSEKKSTKTADEKTEKAIEKRKEKESPQNWLMRRSQ